MRRGLVAFALAVCLSTVFGAIREVRAAENCPATQGAYALALAQVLKFDVATVEAAVSALTGIGVAPDGGWQPEECLTDAVVAQVRAAVERAVANGAVPPSVGTGASDRASTALNVEQSSRVSNERR